MSNVVQIPAGQWRKFCDDMEFLKQSIKALTRTIPTTEWIQEPIAMEMLSVKTHRTMRKIAAEHGINFTCKGNKNYQYLHKDLTKYLKINSTLTNER